MMGPLATIRAQVAALGHPDTAGTAAVAIDRAYKQLWADVHDLGTLLTLRQGLLARNELYEGNAVSNIYKLLKAGHPCVQDPTVAAAVLSILSALFTDVPAAFAAEGYGTHVFDVMDEEELLVPDTSELNTMRAQPLFVRLAIDTLLERPDSVDHDPHVCVGYLNDLIAMDSVDHMTNKAVQRLLDDPGFRSSLFRGLCSQDPHKLLKCLEILKRCVGGGPAQFGGPHYIPPEPSSPQWNLNQLLDLRFEQPLVTACNTVAKTAREHATERQLLDLLHTTLLDVFEVLSCETGNSSGTNADSHPQQQQQQQRHRLSTVTGLGSGAAAAAATSGVNSSGSDESLWPDVLVAAHVGLVIEVARLAPFLTPIISRMRPYCQSTAMSRALHQYGTGPAMSALVAVLDASEPTDGITLRQEISAYQVLNAICQLDQQLALAAVAAGALGVTHSALIEWADMLSLVANQDNAISDQGDRAVVTPDRHELANLGLDDDSTHSDRGLLADHSVRSGSSGLIFEVEGVGDPVPNSTCAAAAYGDDASHSSRRVSAAHDTHAGQQQQQQLPGSVESQLPAAVTAALQLLLTLLRASSRYCTTSSVNTSSNNEHAEVPGSIDNATAAAAAAALILQPEAEADASCSAAALTFVCQQQGLPQLLVEFGQLEIFELLALECLVELNKLTLLPAAVKDILDAALAAAAAAAADAAAAANSGNGSSRPVEGVSSGPENGAALFSTVQHCISCLPSRNNSGSSRNCS